MSCPICKKPQTAEFRPFCSARCTDVDLARWFNEDYRLPAALTEDDILDLEGELEKSSNK